MGVRFRINIVPGSRSEVERRVADAGRRVSEALRTATAALRAAKRAGDSGGARQLSRGVLPDLWNLARMFPDLLPADMTCRVLYSRARPVFRRREAAMAWLEARGLCLPASRRKHAKRIREYVARLEAEGHDLPDELFDLERRLIVDVQ